MMEEDCKVCEGQIQNAMRQQKRREKMVAEQEHSTNTSTPSPVARRLRPDSSESPAPTPTHKRARGRQVSGTLSETSWQLVKGWSCWCYAPAPSAPALPPFAA